MATDWVRKQWCQGRNRAYVLNLCTGCVIPARFSVELTLPTLRTRMTVLTLDLHHNPINVCGLSGLRSAPARRPGKLLGERERR
jgi:hypothetical protein